MSGDEAISVLGVSKDFRPGLALNNVSFDVPRQCLFGLLGPNGAGKTTLFSVAAGFLKATTGRVKVLGIDVENISELRGRFSTLPQDAQFQANVPVIEQLIYFSQLSGKNRHDAEKEANNALKIVRLADAAKKNARVLSHGMSKRMGIAQAFLGDPEVILLDEPTAGLDPVNARGIRDLVTELKKKATVVISSHNLAEIQELCSHVAILDHGKLVECDAVANITKADTMIRMTFARTLTDEETALIKGVAGVSGVVHDSDTKYFVTIDPASSGSTQDDITAAVVQVLAAKGVVARSVEAGAALEDRFLEVTRGRPPA